MKENNLGTEKIWKLFVTVVIPSMLAMVIIGIQGMVDGLFLGNFVSSNAMASVNIALPFLQSSSAIGMIISIGGTAFIGRLLGAGEEKSAKTVFMTSFLTLITSGIVILLVSQFYGTRIAYALGANETLVEEATVYLKIVTLFLPFLLQYYLFSFVNRIIGKPNLFLIGTIVSIVVNLILNYLFIVVLDLGIIGAGLATGISQVTGFIINIGPVLSKKTVVNLYEGKFDLKILGLVAYNGSSEGVTSISTAVTTLVFNLTFMHYYGESGVAAFTIISYISQVANLVIFGIVDGISPIISYNFGANLLERVKKVVIISIILNLAIGLLTYSILYFYGENLIGMFADGDSALIALTYEGAKLYATMFLVSGLNILASSYFTAVGDALKSILISSSRGLIFIIIGVFILPRFLGVTGVWLVAPFADLMTLLFLMYLMIKFHKSKKVAI